MTSSARLEAPILRMIRRRWFSTVREPQLLGDLAVREAAGDEARDLLLALRESISSVPRPGLLREPSSECRIDVPTSTCDLVDAGDELLLDGVLDDISVGARGDAWCA